MPNITNRVTFSWVALLLNTLLLLVVSSTICAQTPAYIDGSQCRHIRVDLARVACYDALTDKAMGQGGATAVAPAPRTAEPAPRAAAPDDYRAQLQEKNREMREELARVRQAQGGGGNTQADKVKQFGKQRVVTTKDGDEVLYDRIKSLRQVPNGWIIQLDSGQIWRQMYSQRYALREGMEVKIAPTIWGNAYRLTVKGLGGFIQVERVK